MTKYKLGEKTIEVVHDEAAENPRMARDCVSKIVALHRRYNFPNDANIRTQDFDGWDAIERHLRKKLGAKVLTPIYLYDHSGLAISPMPFSCPWDSGQIGFAYVDKEGAALLGTNRKAKLERAMLLELKEWGAYVAGEVYTYKNEDDEWGSTYYGDPKTSGLFEDAFGTAVGVKEV